MTYANIIKSLGYRQTQSYGVTQYALTSGRYPDDFHDGRDLANRTHRRVKSLSSGTVFFRGERGDYGLTVKVRLDDGHQLHYSHMARFNVHVGQRVETGNDLGEIGNTGRSTGPHIHVRGLTPQLTKIDPKIIIEANNNNMNTSSREFAEFILNELYLGVYHRPVDKGGLDHFHGRLQKVPVHVVIREIMSGGWANNEWFAFGGRKIRRSQVEALEKKQGENCDLQVAQNTQKIKSEIKKVLDKY